MNFSLKEKQIKGVFGTSLAEIHKDFQIWYHKMTIYKIRGFYGLIRVY